MEKGTTSHGERSMDFRKARHACSASCEEDSHGELCEEKGREVNQVSK